MPKIKTVRGIENRKVVSQKEWIPARKKLLLKEKKFSKLRDKLNLERRKLPWVKIEKEYVFEGPAGKITLADLFDGKSQLIVYHFMFGPGWGGGCEHCSFWADHFDSVNIHIGQCDTAFAVVSRASPKEIEPFKRRMGWQFKWVSSFGTDFNFDFNVSFTSEQIQRGVLPYNYGKFKMKIDEMQGVSAFYRDNNGDIYHTYSSYARGIDLMNTTYNFLDLTAKGRDEEPGNAQDWVRYKDQYKSA
ncbi:MAG TPA: thioredoxin family protein [Verrucomicrobiae bacterium]|nr:thioredoxin family protein [Verrucomicrobiae bacterium]